MLSKETYEAFNEHRKAIEKAKGGGLPKIEHFHSVYAIYRNTFGSINEYCSSCVKEMWDRTYDYLTEYEKHGRR